MNLPLQKRTSEELLREAVVLKAGLRSSDRRLERLVSDLELIMLQIANLSTDSDVSDIEVIKAGVEDRDIFFKINLSEVRPPRASRASGRHRRQGAEIATKPNSEPPRPDKRLLNSRRDNMRETTGHVGTKALLTAGFIVFLALGPATLSVFPAADPQTEDARKFQAVYSLIMEEQWEEAATALDGFPGRVSPEPLD